MDPTPKSHKLLFADILLAVLLIGAIIFGAWAYSGRQDYKNKVDQKVAAAVTVAEKAQADQLQKAFDEQSKSPYKTYKGTATFGTISFSYPKSWSGYVDETGTDQPLNAYFYPNVVPGIADDQAYALRVQLVSVSYSDSVVQYDGSVQDGSLSATAFIPPKLKNTANVQPGTRLDGSLSDKKKGAIAIIKVRDKTLLISTESTDFLADFNNVILPSLSFTP